MKIRLKENGEEHEIDVNMITVIDKDGIPFRIKQDIEKGIEIISDVLFEKLYIEPHTNNSVTLLAR